MNNCGDDALIFGYSFKYIGDIFKKNTRQLLMIYFFLLTLLRLKKYAPQKYSISKAKQIIGYLKLNVNGKEDFFKLWGSTQIAETFSRYKAVGHIIFAYIHALRNNNIISFDNLNLANDIFSEDVQNALANFIDESVYTLSSEIIGYALYVQHTLANFKHKQASESINFLYLPNKMCRKFDLKEIEVNVEEFSAAEVQQYINRNNNVHTVRHLKDEYNL